MIENATVYIFAPIVSKNSEGSIGKSWGYLLPDPTDPVATFRADVQPAALSKNEMLAWGLSNANADVKKMFGILDSSVVPPNRIVVVSDFDDDVAVYTIFGKNRWPGHMEALLVPVVGETAPSAFVLNADPSAKFGLAYVWVDFALWFDDRVWKD